MILCSKVNFCCASIRSGIHVKTNPHKKKLLPALILSSLCAVGALTASGSASAVHVNPDGVGQVLFYPYYTVRNGNVTAMSIVNTTSLTKAVKVRFLEGRNGREVLDFNLFRSPTDVWTGVVLLTTEGAKLETGDNSCVTPSNLFGDANGAIRTDARPAPVNQFSNAQYTGRNVDNPTMGSLDRTREGHIEVFEMGIVTDATLAGFIKHATSGATTGRPANCAALDAFEGTSTAATPAVKFPGQYLLAPAGGLTGRASIINSATGTNYTYDVTALDGWWAPVAPGPGNVPYSAPGVTTPSISLQAGIDTVSHVMIPGIAATDFAPRIPSGVLRAVWASPREAVSAVLMRTRVINEFVTDNGTVSKTDWVFSMPTKRDFIIAGIGTLPNRPFSNNFANETATGACDSYSLTIFNRETGSPTPNPGGFTIFPPLQQPLPGQYLCWQSNVVEFGSSGLLGSTNNHQLPGPFAAFAATTATTTGFVGATLSRRTLQGPNGWAVFKYGATTDPIAGQAQQSITPLSATLNGVAVGGTHFGLPIIGTMFHNYTNSGVSSIYGGVVPHRYTRQIDLAARAAP